VAYGPRPVAYPWGCCLGCFSARTNRAIFAQALSKSVIYIVCEGITRQDTFIQCTFAGKHPRFKLGRQGGKVPASDILAAVQTLLLQSPAAIGKDVRRHSVLISAQSGLSIHSMLRKCATACDQRGKWHVLL
jgi:hypothetical protein